MLDYYVVVVAVEFRLEVTETVPWRIPSMRASCCAFCSLEMSVPNEFKKSEMPEAVRCEINHLRMSEQ